MVFTLRWGIIATGWISEMFLKDLLVDPGTRMVSDIMHKPVAVGSRSVDKATKFIAEFAPGIEGIKAYGTYEGLVNDPDIDIVYIGSMNSMHYRDSLLALRAGKHVLCEKGFTINAVQARHLASVAKEMNLFIMEAAWTRFFPLTLAFQKLLHEERVIGRIRRMTADCGHYHKFVAHNSNRVYSLDLGGGSLLNLGVYAMLWTVLVCYHHPDNNKARPSSIKASMIKAPVTGVDQSTAIIMVWNNPQIISVSTSTVALDAPKDKLVCVEGDLGQLVIPLSTPQPRMFVLRLNGQPEKRFEFPIPGGGMGLFYEADAVARDIRVGKIVNDRCPIDESIMIMEIFDEVRRQNDLIYPEATEFAEDGGLDNIDRAILREY